MFLNHIGVWISKLGWNSYFSCAPNFPKVRKAVMFCLLFSHLHPFLSVCWIHPLGTFLLLWFSLSWSCLCWCWDKFLLMLMPEVLFSLASVSGIAHVYQVIHIVLIVKLLFHLSSIGVFMIQSITRMTVGISSGLQSCCWSALDSYPVCLILPKIAQRWYAAEW